MAGDVIHDTEHRSRRTSGPPLTVIKPTAMPGSPRGGHGAPPCDPLLLCPPPPPRGPPAAHATVDFAFAPRFTFLVTLHPTRGHRSETRGRRPARGRLTWHPLCVRRWVRGSPSHVRPRSRTRTPHFPIAPLPLPGLTLGSGTAGAMTTRSPRPPSACARLARRRVPHRGVPHRGEGTSGRFPLVRTASVRVRAHQLWASVVRCRLPFY